MRDDFTMRLLWLAPEISQLERGVTVALVAIGGALVGVALTILIRRVPARVPRYRVVEILTAAAFGMVAWWFAWFVVPATPQTIREQLALYVLFIAFLYLASISIALTFIDRDVHRLPDMIVLPSYAVVGGLFSAASFLSHDWGALLRAIAGMSALYLFYFLLRVAQPSGMGGGDVKLAGVIGLYLGYAGWSALLIGAVAAFLWGGIFGALLIATRKAGRKTAIPFGPWMIAGAWTGLFAGELLTTWYLRSFASG